jgi:hypothetical protein
MSQIKSPSERWDGADAASFPPLPPNASVGKRWKFRRNVVIYVAHRQGISQRVLADVFDLPRSRIASIVKQFSDYDPWSKPDRTLAGSSPARRRPVARKGGP